MSLGSTILVVDDELLITEFVREILTEEGYNVRVAHDGASAVIDVQTNPPALVLIDNALPVISGLEVVEQLRSAGFTQLPIIGMSAISYPELFFQAGADDFLDKPFNIEELLACIAQHLTIKEREKPASA